MKQAKKQGVGWFHRQHHVLLMAKFCGPKSHSVVGFYFWYCYATVAPVVSPAAHCMLVSKRSAFTTTSTVKSTSGSTRSIPSHSVAYPGWRFCCCCFVPNQMIDWVSVPHHHHSCCVLYSSPAFFTSYTVLINFLACKFMVDPEIRCSEKLAFSAIVIGKAGWVYEYV